MLLGIKGKTVAIDDNSYEIVVEEDNSWISDEEMTREEGKRIGYVMKERKVREEGKRVGCRKKGGG